MKRRRPQQQEVRVQEEPKCPVCPHRLEEHNQFGCCFEEEVCACLMTPKTIQEANVDQNADS